MKILFNTCTMFFTVYTDSILYEKTGTKSVRITMDFATS